MGDLVRARRGPLLVALVMGFWFWLGAGHRRGNERVQLAARCNLCAGTVTSLVVALIVTPALLLLVRDGQPHLRAGPLDRWICAGADRPPRRRSASPAG